MTIIPAIISTQPKSSRDESVSPKITHPPKAPNTASKLIKMAAEET